MTTTELTTSPFTIAVDQDVLDDLADRLARTRWPRVVDPADAAGGLSLELAQRLVEHWRHRFDWRATEASLNRLPQFVAEIGGIPVHHVHTRAARTSGVPVLLLHGWPDSFARYAAVIDPLTAAGHDVVVPSLPGYGFSGEPDGPLSTALHLTDVPFAHMFELDPAQVSDAKRALVERNEGDPDGRLVYQVVQSAQPMLLSYGLTDSPVALATWVYDKFRAWSDREPDLDAVLTQVMIAWVSGSIRSALRPYAEAFEWGAAPVRATAPTAFALFPADLQSPPREYAERFFDVRRFTQLPRGGHFAAIEEPQLLVEDLLAFLQELA